MGTTLDSYIEQRANRDGALRAYIAGTRVRVQDVYAMSELQGQSPDEILRALPHLTLAKIHAALAYFFDHREEIVKEIREDQRIVDLVRSVTGPGPLERKGQSAHVGQNPLSS